uniref:Uncharacterized protein n=1 Tax=Aplanochytrium stocchinoi TaxID=215587 RepID=A0A7S3UY57_9STRA|mmetsp:Transcript_12661/g.15725  ORF Transcript_12661/g.15725 Transcript_12661/m.15725 type:complete len:216 (+) Transcript_12661:42-689(+)|eukprot:CAMPEP_0204833528 /NCGR_PEP_ID=MMETSP1346-20131115/17053_1 /ASSEMBLY_ACC=CAM_ASM_000771 /TAXON_ID=215587 /ORGANISM="Aplanochytrium stocchinoi, Strain GSBS06" /LENGTH=215 /DNA_ID=CAMNT_0051966125 /DNA_START=286 /DNA_END=933 /DNA_ORIENTATION=-
MVQYCFWLKFTLSLSVLLVFLSSKHVQAELSRDLQSDDKCCKALTAECLACAEGIPVEEYCAVKYMVAGCREVNGEYELDNHVEYEHSEYEYEYLDEIYEYEEVKHQCCTAMTPLCIGCTRGMDREEFCRTEDGVKFPECSQFRHDIAEKEQKTTKSRSSGQIFFIVSAVLFMSFGAATVFYCTYFKPGIEASGKAVETDSKQYVDPVADHSTYV